MESCIKTEKCKSYEAGHRLYSFHLGASKMSRHQASKTDVFRQARPSSVAVVAIMQYFALKIFLPVARHFAKRPTNGQEQTDTVPCTVKRTLSNKGKANFLHYKVWIGNVHGNPRIQPTDIG